MLLPLAVALLAASVMPAAAQSFDHSLFDGVLSRAVSAGLVDYARIGGDRAFERYMAALATARPEELGADERLAFWINAYNACVIQGVLDNPGMTRPTDVKGFFDKRTFPIAGRRVTLDEIENRIIRPTFREKLVHFGLVCAARSCPPLAGPAFTGATVRAELARRARLYLASPRNRIDQGSGALQLSKIFDWYRDDFGGDRGIRAFVASYGTPEMRAAIERAPTTPITFLEYDWRLNGR